MNVFATVLTYRAPSANYRGESEENRTVIQRVTDGRFEYAVVSPEAMRNAVREILAGYGLPTNRTRVHTEEQLAVTFKEYPDPERFADDFFFGYLLALDGGRRKEFEKARGKGVPTKRDSILRMNLAKAIEPYRHDAILTQSPMNTQDSPWQNAGSSALLHRETTVTAFQYPLALNLNDCRLDEKKLGKQYREWLRSLLRAISELSNVAGNHARSYFEMAPASIVIRKSESLVAGYDTYGFGPDGTFPEVVQGIETGDYPGAEFLIGGRIVREMPQQQSEPLTTKGTRLFRMANEALDALARDVTGAGFLAARAA
jgi:CRISPR-associated protein Cst2